LSCSAFNKNIPAFSTKLAFSPEPSMALLGEQPFFEQEKRGSAEQLKEKIYSQSGRRQFIQRKLHRQDRPTYGDSAMLKTQTQSKRGLWGEEILPNVISVWIQYSPL